MLRWVSHFNINTCPGGCGAISKKKLRPWLELAVRLQQATWQARAANSFSREKSLVISYDSIG